MKHGLISLILLLLAGGCASKPAVQAPAADLPADAKGPNWEEIDKTVERVKEREKQKPRFVETERTVEQGFLPMSDADYASALATAREEVRKENPKLSESDLESEAMKRADEAKARYERSVSRRASSTYQLKKP